MCHLSDIRLPLLHVSSERIVRHYFESHMTYALLKMEIILCLVISWCHSTITAMSNSTSLKLLSLVTQRVGMARIRHFTSDDALFFGKLYFPDFALFRPTCVALVSISHELRALKILTLAVSK